jgi:hypothetical protein
MRWLYSCRVVLAATILLSEAVTPALARDYLIAEDVVGCVNASDYSKLLQAAGGVINLNAGRVPAEFAGELNHLLQTGFCTIFQAGCGPSTATSGTTNRG